MTIPATREKPPTALSTVRVSVCEVTALVSKIIGGFPIWSPSFGKEQALMRDIAKSGMRFLDGFIRESS
jgi:hypothetical protein